MYTRKDYEHLVDSLLPRGPIWRWPKGGLGAVCFALASEAARIDSEIEDILEESDPRSSIKELEQWFADFGVPSACIKAISEPTQEQIRSDLLAKITQRSGLTKRYFESIAEILGFQASVNTYDQYSVLCDVTNPLADEAWKPVFFLNVSIAGDAGLDKFVTTWDASQPLAKWGNVLLECLIRATAPAHTLVIFTYPEGE